MIVVWLILLSKWHRHISSSSSPEDLSDVTFHVLIKRHRVLDKTYLLSSFPWPPLLGHAPHVSLSYVSEVLRRLPMPSCLDLAITDIALRAIIFSYFYRFAERDLLSEFPRRLINSFISVSKLFLLFPTGVSRSHFLFLISSYYASPLWPHCS